MEVCRIPRVPPKPLLMPLTAVIGEPSSAERADVYCDTQNIVRALSDLRRQTITTDETRGRILAFTDWADVIFNLAARVVLTSASIRSLEFIQDRAGYISARTGLPRDSNLSCRE